MTATRIIRRTPRPLIWSMLAIGLAIVALTVRDSVAQATVKRVAVLDLGIRDNAVTEAEADLITELVREAATRALPVSRFIVMTKANMVVFIPEGKSLRDCLGECAVEAGRNVGAHYVVGGEILRYGKQLRVLFSLHDTTTGGQLSSGRAGAAVVDELEAPVAEAAGSLFAAIYTPPTPLPTPITTPVPTPWPTSPSYVSTPAPTPSAPSAPPGMRYIQGGSFLMGCSPGDKDCFDDEKPAHNVTLNSFYADITEVTQAQFRQVMGTNPSKFSGCDDCPVEQVDWSQARDYCARVGKRLPTEAEWEYAARGGTTGSRYGELDSIAWYDGNSGGKTHPVGGKQPNAYGLYDMLGNVWEWTSDGYSDNYNAARVAALRVLRGGSWYVNPRLARASNRDWSNPTYRIDYRRGPLFPGRFLALEPFCPFAL